jgi:hypothetical protein
MPRVLLVAVVLLSLFGVTACGSDNTKSANTYVSAVNEAQNRFADTFDQLQREITPTSSVRQDRATLAKFSQAVDRVVAQLRAVKPPDKVKSLHTDLIAAISSYRTEVEKARKAFASRDRKTFMRTERRFVARVQAISERINKTIAAINAKLHE